MASYSLLLQYLVHPLHWFAASMITTLYLLLYNPTGFSRPFVVVYLVHIYFSRGSDPSFIPARVVDMLVHAFRSNVHFGILNSMWSAAAGHLRLRVHKCADLPRASHKSHLFIAHPHGIFGLATQGAFGTNSCKLDELYPALFENGCSGIRLAGLGAMFKLPFAREYLILAGCIDVSSKTLSSVLRGERNASTITGSRRECVGHCVINVGGAAESVLRQEPKKMKVLLQDRKGFVRVGLRHGCVLVPCVAYREWDVYHTRFAQPGTNECMC